MPVSIILFPGRVDTSAGPFLVPTFASDSGAQSSENVPRNSEYMGKMSGTM
jgi:hypothetical protein